MTSTLVIDADDSVISAGLLARIHSPHAGRVVVIADPSRSVVTMLQDVLMGVGPDREGQGWPKTAERARAWVSAWIRGRPVDELVVAHADRLEVEQLRELVHITEHSTRLWLLARTSMRATDVQLRIASVDAFLAHCDLVLEDTGLLPERLSRFPSVPLDGMLIFRQRCHELLRPDEFLVVDDLLYRSCSAARYLLDASGDKTTPWGLVEPALAHDYPPSAAITALRGCQLACFSRGLHLSFDVHALNARLNASPRLHSMAAHLLGVDTDPANAVLLVARALGATTEEVARLTLDALDPTGRQLTLRDGTRSVPRAVAHILAIYYDVRMRSVRERSPAEIALFARGNDPTAALTVSTLERRAQQTSRRLGIACDADHVIRPEHFRLERLVAITGEEAREL